MDYIIETDFEGPNFTMVPNAVAQSGAFSAEALGVLVYLASLPRGYVLRVATVQEVFKIGKDKWQRIARELRDGGAMEVQIVRGAGGRAVGRRVSVRWPKAEVLTESRKSPLSDRKPEKPAVGKPAKQGGQTRQTGRANPAPYKDQRSKKAKHGQQNVGTVAALQQIADLSPFLLSRIRDGNTVLIGNELVEAGSPQMAALQQAAAAQAAEKGASHGNVA